MIRGFYTGALTLRPLSLRTCRLADVRFRTAPAIHWSLRLSTKASGECAQSKHLAKATDDDAKLLDNASPDSQPVDKKGQKKPMDRTLMKHVAILTGSQLMLNLGFSQVVPVLPLFAQEMGGHLGATGVGMIIAAPSVSRLLCNIPLGRLCDTVGRKPLMWAGTGCTAIGTVATGFVGSVEAMLPCRLLVGVGSSASMTGSTAYMQDLSDREPEHRAKILGFQQATIGTVWIVGPAIGGLLADWYGYQNSFIIAGIGSALCSLGYRQLPETLRPAGHSFEQSLTRSSLTTADPVTSDEQEPNRSFRQEIRAWWKDASVLLVTANQQALIALACVSPLRGACFMTVISLYAAQQFEAGPKDLGLLFSAIAATQLVGMPLGSFLADRYPKKSLIVPAGVVSCVAFTGIGLAPTYSALLGCLAVQGVMSAAIQPATGAFTAEVTPKSLRGQAGSLQRQAADVLSLTAPVSLGLLCDATSAPFVMGVVASMMGCSYAFFGFVANEGTTSIKDQGGSSEKIP